MTAIRMTFLIVLLAGFSALNAQMVPFTNYAPACSTTGNPIASAGSSVSFMGAGYASCSASWNCLNCQPNGGYQPMSLTATASSQCAYWRETASVSWNPLSGYTVTSTAQVITAGGVLGSSLSQQAYCTSTMTTNQSGGAQLCKPT
jgi:hypothetical protein